MNNAARVKSVMLAAVVGAVGLARAEASAPTAVTICPTADTYLEADGSQAFDTGFCPGPATRIVADMRVSYVNSGTWYLFGTSDTGGATSYREFVYTARSSNSPNCYYINWYTLGKNQWGSFDSSLKGEVKDVRLVYDYDLPGKKFSVKLNGSSTETFSSALTPSAATSTLPLGLLTRVNRDSEQKLHYDGSFPAAKVYSFKVYDGGVLVRDMIPYGYGAVTGLYDRCEGKVYLPKGNGSRPPNALKIGTDGGAVVADANSWLDTGCKVTSKTKVEVDFSLTAEAPQARVFGAFGAGGACVSLHVSESKKLARTYQDSDSDGSIFTYDGGSTEIVADGRRFTYVMDGPGLSETLSSGGRTYCSGTLSPLTTETAAPLGITSYLTIKDDAVFCGTKINDHATMGKVKIYSFRIWEDGVLVRDYEPRLRDSVVGLYDKVNGTFSCSGRSAENLENYGSTGAIVADSANGSGAAHNGDACLKVVRRQFVDTGVHPTATTKVWLDLATPYAPSKSGYYTGYIFGHGGFCGVYAASGIWYGVGRNGTTGKWPTVGTTNTFDRCQWTFDTNAQTIEQRSGETLLKSVSTMGTPSDTGVLTVLLFARATGSVESPSSDGWAEAICYGCKIWDGGQLVRDFRPAQVNGQAGLWDVCEGKLYGSGYSGSSVGSLSVCGGQDPNGAFVVQPQGGEVPFNGIRTLTAVAPGAIGYQWYRNGQLIEGATGNSLDVPWARGPAVGYTCVASYAHWGYAASDVAEVTGEKMGTIILVK